MSQVSFKSDLVAESSTVIAKLTQPGWPVYKLILMTVLIQIALTINKSFYFQSYPFTYKYLDIRVIN